MMSRFREKSWLRMPLRFGRCVSRDAVDVWDEGKAWLRMLWRFGEAWGQHVADVWERGVSRNVVEVWERGVSGCCGGKRLLMRTGEEVWHKIVVKAWGTPEVKYSLEFWDRGLAQNADRVDEKLAHGTDKAW
ncbi:hypothetical protein NDU88_008692 [Pleurodeles waltl]|uniref:Uncharacterized protein n=1 Tax=Pleurodeles waltl TaxID=8319 RepID=A0AAV7PTT9_PLEWA|nr:hypothetical protein NDU88_008692 [Pleurodeles waltl]